ncbi:hypothetical protein PsorP6_017162 [Peronosclerospora sorghi]|uniref:Uncharacterized protein n=1 Tax=Peronosclerospora sorghi TaxID=230839 RepID=A0ACC0WCJ3_9STRA|nr:hypothetical protein PsorP6_017162 [Peronosclerospora sorghi]
MRIKRMPPKLINYGTSFIKLDHDGGAQASSGVREAFMHFGETAYDKDRAESLFSRKITEANDLDQLEGEIIAKLMEHGDKNLAAIELFKKRLKEYRAWLKEMDG